MRPKTFKYFRSSSSKIRPLTTIVATTNGSSNISASNSTTAATSASAPAEPARLHVSSLKLGLVDFEREPGILSLDRVRAVIQIRLERVDGTADGDGVLFAEEHKEGICGLGAVTVGVRHDNVVLVGAVGFGALGDTSDEDGGGQGF